jgi:hypothetical protein
MRIRYIRLGADMSRAWFDVCLHIKADQIFSQRFDNTEEGVKELFSWLDSHKVQKVHACMEHTGGDETLLASLLFYAGHRVSVVDGFKASRHREGKTRSKTDPGDARELVRYLKERKPALWAPAPDRYRHLGELDRARPALLYQRDLPPDCFCGSKRNRRHLSVHLPSGSGSNCWPSADSLSFGHNDEDSSPNLWECEIAQGLVHAIERCQASRSSIQAVGGADCRQRPQVRDDGESRAYAQAGPCDLGSASSPEAV